MTKKPMSEAPRDGRVIILGSEHMEEVRMRWDRNRLNPLTRQRGIWASPDGVYTWNEDQPEYGPQYWRDTE